MKQKSIIITGQTGSGKTTLADEMGKELGMEVQRCDDCIQPDREKAGRAVRAMIGKEGVISEGAMAMRGVDRLLKENPNELPFDRIIFMEEPYENLNPRQASIGLMGDTVLKRNEAALKRHGVTIERRKKPAK